MGLNQNEQTEADRLACRGAWGAGECLATLRSGEELPDLPKGDQSEKVRLHGRRERWPDTGILEVRTQPVWAFDFKSFPRLVLLILRERKAL